MVGGLLVEGSVVPNTACLDMAEHMSMVGSSVSSSGLKKGALERASTRIWFLPSIHSRLNVYGAMRSRRCIRRGLLMASRLLAAGGL